MGHSEDSSSSAAHKDRVNQWARKRKRSNFPNSPVELEVANILLMLAGAVMPLDCETHSPKRTSKKKTTHHRQKKKTMPTELESAISDVSTISTDNERNETHVCKVCGKFFSSGQALGGHMRRHYEGPIGGKNKGGDSSLSSNIEVEEEEEEEEEDKPRLLIRFKLGQPAAVETEPQLGGIYGESIEEVPSLSNQQISGF